MSDVPVQLYTGVIVIMNCATMLTAAVDVMKTINATSMPLGSQGIVRRMNHALVQQQMEDYQSIYGPSQRNIY